MATDVWETVTVDGVDYWQIETTRFLVPVDWVPGSKMFIAVAAATGQGNFPAAIQGDPGDTPTIDTTINLTALESDDSDPDAASWTEISPDTYQLQLTLHKGPQGDPGETTLTLSDFGTPAAGKILVVNAGADDLEYQTQKVGDRFLPATIANTPSGNTSYTLCTVAVGAQGFDWRPVVEGHTIVTPYGGTDVIVDLFARLNSTGGNIVGSCHGIGGVTERLTLDSAPPAGSATGYDTVAAGASATIYLCAERRSGTQTFTTSGSTSSFAVRVAPIP